MKSKNSNPIITMMKAEWQNLGDNKKTFVFYMGLFTIAGIIGLLSPWLVGSIFNSIQNGEITTEQELTKLFLMLSLLIVIQVGFWVFYGTAKIMQMLTSFQVHKNYANNKIKKTLELSVKWHKDNHSGDTIDRINKARLSLFSYSQHSSSRVISIMLNIFGALAIIFFIDIKIGTFSLIFCSIILFLSMSLDKKVKTYHKNVNKFEHKFSAAIFDYFSNIATVITLRLRGVARKKLDEKIDASYEDHKKVTYLMVMKWGTASMAITLMMVLALIYRAYTDFNTTGIILIGTLFMLYSYLDRVGRSFFEFSQFYGEMTKKAADIEAAEPIDNAFKKIEEEIETKLPKKWKQIDIKNLDFTYNQEGSIRHLDNIDFSFKRGQKIALIGESGSGKSTVLTLLRGLYPPQKVSVFCDGKKLRNKIKTLNHSVTLIPQDPEIFNETIRYNITMDMFSNSADLKKAIQMAQFGTVVDRLEKGVDTNIQEKGVSLSGGEKQRLALARGLLAAKDSDIVLLDEPTSSVDSSNERKIHENIFNEFKDKTIISSIHRLHLLPKFDYIYMFERGKIVGQGTFKEIKNDPRFKKIWKSYIGSMKK
jgi:ABC-type multidrug transport system fused ATPase/permease subunit